MVSETLFINYKYEVKLNPFTNINVFIIKLTSWIGYYSLL